MQLEAEGDWDR